jgi:hypothetical protein
MFKPLFDEDVEICSIKRTLADAGYDTGGYSTTWMGGV